jgi:hypothetical protein
MYASPSRRPGQVPSVAAPAIKKISLVIEWKKGTTRSQANAADCDSQHLSLIDQAIADSAMVVRRGA